MFRNLRTLSVLTVLLALAAITASSTVRAQQPAATPALDAAAVKALTDMSAYLRGLKSFQVVSETTTDEVLDDGQTIQYASKVNFLVQMPNRLLADVSSDRNRRSFFYDGKSFTLWARRVGYYATIPAPATLRELDDLLADKYDIELPLADLFRFGSPRWNASAIKSARDMGPREVDGITCQHYAFRQDDVDFQIWIQKGEFPLPRRLAITTTSEAAKPQYIARYAWNMAPSVSDAAFTFVPPADAKKIVLAAVGQQ